jgi:GDP-L-fucose synthase
MEMIDKNSKIYVAGHKGLVGSSIVSCLKNRGFSNVVVRTHKELDLINQAAVHRFFDEQNFDYVMLSAAKVGGILYNQSFQADFLYENVMIAANVIHASAQSNVKKLLYLGSSCIYPKHAPQPIREESLLSGALEPTNEGYALAKIMGLKLCEKYHTQYDKRFISAMPTNLYGPHDNFHPSHSHVIPGMMRRFHEAKTKGMSEVVIWGTGTPKREFLFIEDLAEALFLLMQKYEGPQTINIGTGEDCTILELAELMKQIVGYEGRIRLDPSKPDGTPRKVLDVSRIRSLGWQPKNSLKEGLAKGYRWALDNKVFEAD